jgi:beta-ureidopropionase
LVSPCGQLLTESSDDLVNANLDLSVTDEVRQTWQFYRDRRPDAHDEIVRG